MPEYTQWEYLTMTLGSFWNPGKDEELQQRLNEIGEQGWEIICVYPIENTKKSRVIAKRILTASIRRNRNMPEF